MQDEFNKKDDMAVAKYEERHAEMLPSVKRIDGANMVESHDVGT
jgi:hypothetical protein